MSRVATYPGSLFACKLLVDGIELCKSPSTLLICSVVPGEIS